MNARAKYWGFIGAAGVLFSIAVFCASASGLQKAAGIVWRAATYPVTAGGRPSFALLRETEA
jgi:hypothetical protein